MGNKATQCELILAYMEKHGGITQLEATDAIRCSRLAARISDLRKVGYPIRGKRVRYIAADGKKSSFTRYYMDGGSGG